MAKEPVRTIVAAGYFEVRHDSGLFFFINDARGDKYEVELRLGDAIEFETSRGTVTLLFDRLES